MKFRQKLQLFILSVSVVAFFLLISIYFIVGEDNSKLSSDESDRNYLEINNERISFFIDTNRNQTKDTTESPCTQCVGKQVLIEITTDIGRDLVERIIEEESTLNLEAAKVSSLWSYLPQEKLIIPYFSFDGELSGTEIFIPVEEVGYDLAGENANIGSILVEEISRNNYENTMVLTKLVPVLNTFYNSEQQLWILYYPNLESKNNYYLSSTKITQGTGTQSEMSSLWHLLGNYSTLENSSNYRILTTSL